MERLDLGDLERLLGDLDRLLGDLERLLGDLERFDLGDFERLDRTSDARLRVLRSRELRLSSLLLERLRFLLTERSLTLACSRSKSMNNSIFFFFNLSSIADFSDSSSSSKTSSTTFEGFGGGSIETMLSLDDSELVLCLFSGTTAGTLGSLEATSLDGTFTAAVAVVLAAPDGTCSSGSSCCDTSKLAGVTGNVLEREGNWKAWNMGNGGGNNGSTADGAVVELLLPGGADGGRGIESKHGNPILKSGAAA